MEQYRFKDLTESIIGAAFKVHNELGGGFLEKVYRKSLVIELNELGMGVEEEHPIKVYYRGILVGEYIADIIVEDKVIIELKAVRNIAPIHEVQLVNYLKATGIEVGLVINFGNSVEIKRKILDNNK